MKRSEIFERFATTEAVRRDLKKKSVRGAVLMASSGGLELLLRFASIAILARLLVPEYFGLVAMVTAFTGVADGVRDLGLGTATVQRHEITHRQVTNLFWINALAGVLFTLLFCALSPVIGSFYRDDRLVTATAVLSVTFLWSGLSVQHEALLSRQLRQGELALIRLLASLGSIAVAVVLALADYGYWALVWREVSSRALFALGVWIRCPWLPGLPGAGVGTRSFVKFGRDVTLTHLLTSLIANIDRLLIGRFYGASPVGLYRQAQQLLVLPIDQLNGPIMSVAQPGLSALQREPERYRRYYEKIAFLVTLATFPLGIFVAVYAKEITLLVLGPAWTEAATLIVIFGLAAAIRPAIATSAIVLITTGNARKYLIVTVVHSVVLTLLLLVGVRWGAEGVAVAHVATTALLMVPKLYYSFLGTPVKLRDFFYAVQTPWVAGLAMLAGLLILRTLMPLDGILLPLVVGSAAGGALYCAVWLLQPKGKRQFMALAADLTSSLRARAVVHERDKASTRTPSA